MKQTYVTKRFGVTTLTLIDQVNEILSEYEQQGYTLSLRQLYYQLVARDIVPNSLKSYTKVGTTVSDARLAGLIDWAMIEDRGREVHYPSHWTDPGHIIKNAAQGFRINRWEGQPCYIEVMVEKDALSGILEPICRELDVRFTANKGYSSSSALYEAGLRINKAVENNLEVHVIYFGDHDPSGIDMTRDIEERLSLFSFGAEITVDRLALNYDQVQLYKPPENPAKVSDSRFFSYEQKYGKSSWELDALEPKVLSDLVTKHIVALLDTQQWRVIQKKEDKMKKELLELAKEYEHKKWV